MITKLLIEFFLVCFFVLFIWAILHKSKTVKNDWKTLEYLQKRCYEVKTKQEIEEFHKEFKEKSSKIFNQFIRPELFKIDGYLRGLYKNL